MSAEEIRVDDVSTEIEVTVTRKGLVMDLTSAAVKQFIFKKPNANSTITKDVGFVTDGTDGVLIYRTEEGFLDTPGTWKLQVYLEIGAWKGRSTVVSFEVHRNL